MSLSDANRALIAKEISPRLAENWELRDISFGSDALNRLLDAARAEGPAKPQRPHGYSDGETRRGQIKEGSLNRWKAAFGLTEAEVYEAREIAQRGKFHMHEACRMVQRSSRQALP